MDDQRIGWTLRAIRLRKRWRQCDLAARARVSRWIVLRIEHGRLASVPVGKLRAVAAALDARIDTVVRWHGGDLPRLLSARHSKLHENMARFFGDLPEWIVEPEVSFSIYGERGIIDVLAWRPARRILLVIELKTEIVDVNETLGTLDRKRRLAIDRPRAGMAAASSGHVAGRRAGEVEPTDHRRSRDRPPREAPRRRSRDARVAATP